MANNPNNGVHNDTMKLLQNILHKNHQYAAIYMHTYEIIHGHESEDICIQLQVAPGN